MKRRKLFKHANVQNMQTFKVAKHANIERRKTFKHATAQILQTFKGAKDAHIQGANYNT